MAHRKSEDRIGFISFLQFIGVISVIFGHSMNSIPVPEALTAVKAWVYTYHMPLFFFVSAFLFSYKGGYAQGCKNVLLKRLKRLIVPYFIWNILFIIPKVLFRNFIYDEVEFSLSYFLRITLRPRDNILGHTWFLFCLFEMFVIAIVLDRAKSKKQLWIPLILALAVVNCFDLQNRWFAVGDLMKNGVFFWCGLLLGTIAPEKIERALRNGWNVASSAVLVAGTTVVWAFRQDMTFNTLVLGFSALALFMCIQAVTGIRGGLIDFVSRNSFAIYILHWPVIMILRLVFFQKLGLPPVASMLVNMALGFAIPCGIVLVVKRFKAPWIKKLSAVILGM